MGRGRQKAKQTKVARELKYFSPDTDYKALERELHTSTGPVDGRRDGFVDSLVEVEDPAHSNGHAGPAAEDDDYDEWTVPGETRR